MAFIDEDYKEPKTSRYAKIEEGKNKFRILGESSNGTLIMGSVLWTNNEKGDRKPKRLMMGEAHQVGDISMNPKTGEMDSPKTFWAFPVWAYASEQVEILELTQKTIREAILELSRNPKWGDPKEYDITINQIKEKGKTSYTVTPDPKENLPKEIEEAYKKLPLNLKALYSTKENPFGTDPFVMSAEDVSKAINE